MNRLRLDWLIATVAACVAFTACTGSCGPKPHPVPHSASNPDQCAAACQNYRRLSCPAGNPTPGGATCETVCANIIAAGGASYDLGCRAAATSCAAADHCEGQP